MSTPLDSLPTPETDALAVDVVNAGGKISVILATYSDKCKSLERRLALCREALEDMLSGWKYIRYQHGDLYGVGWDRAQRKAENALDLAKPPIV